MQELSNFLMTLEDELVRDEANFESCDSEVKQALSDIRNLLKACVVRIPKVASDIACTQRQLDDVDKELSHLWESIKETNDNVLARQNV
jgi:peptidoglycan hydrolase CwlO-like protein